MIINRRREEIPGTSIIAMFRSSDIKTSHFDMRSGNTGKGKAPHTTGPFLICSAVQFERALITTSR